MKHLENFTIIIPCINFKDVKKSLINIRKLYKTVKIIVCLNQKMKPTKDRNLYFINTKAKGIGEKRNLAVKKAKTKYLAFIDSDAYPSKGWLESNQKLIENKKIGIIAGPHIDPIKQTLEESIIGQVKKSFIITMNPSLQKKNQEKKRFVSFMPSCNWIMKKKNFLKFGCMNPNMRRNEDWDFVYNKMAKNDYKILYNPKSKIYHENYNIIHFIKKRFLYGFYMMPILKKININNLYFLIPLIFSIFLISFPLVHFSEMYKQLYISTILVYFLIVLFESFRVSKNIFLSPLVFLIMIFGNIAPGFGILIGIFNINIKELEV